MEREGYRLYLLSTGNYYSYLSFQEGRKWIARERGREREKGTSFLIVKEAYQVQKYKQNNI